MWNKESRQNYKLGNKKRNVGEIIKNMKLKYAGRIIRQEKDHWGGGRKLLNKPFFES